MLLVVRRVLLGLIAALLVAACGNQPVSQPADQPAQRELVVFAAASLSDSFKLIGQRFEAQNPGVSVTFNFGASGQLRHQLEQGAHADVFASANTKEITAAISSSLLLKGTERVFARNRLLVIFPPNNPAQIQTLADLARPGVALVMADKAVPAGQYALSMLDALSADAQFGAGFKSQVLANVVSYEENVRAVVSKVTLGEADAGIVYTSDRHAEPAGALGALDIPDRFNQLATYPIAPLTGATDSGLAQAFVTFVISPAGQEVLTQYGFLPIDKTS